MDTGKSLVFLALSIQLKYPQIAEGIDGQERRILDLGNALALLFG